MKQRKVIALFHVFLMICSLILTTGCGKDPEPVEDSIVMSYDEAEGSDVSSADTETDDEAEYFGTSGDDHTDENGEGSVVSSGTEQGSQSSDGTTSENRGYYTASDYIANPSLFVPSWKGTWNPPAELLDFEKKWEAFFTPNGRLMSMAHRGDNDICYPEDSIEGIMSCIAAGVDFLELDVRTTSDGELVLMHDSNITRTTNVNALRSAGVTGLPSSNEISDWTLDQLRQLRLVHETSSGNKVTNYVIPTLEDAIMVCANKIFVFLDIKDGASWDTQIYPMIEQYRAYRSFWLPASYSTKGSTLNTYLTGIAKDSGYKAAFQAAITPTNVASVVNTIETYGLPKALRSSDYSPSYDTAYAAYFGKYRMSTNALYSPYNNLSAWKTLHAKGYNLLHVDDYMTLLKYIAQQL